ncbi:MAG: AraC family transcriptional regulator [Reyranella sp.]
MTNLIRSACLTSYPEIARSLGLQPLHLLASCGIDRRCLEDPDLKLPSEALGRLLEASARAAGVEDFGLRLAETRTFSVLGPLGLLVREEATMRDALRSLMRYIPLHNEAIYLRLEEHGDEAIICLEIRAARLAPIRQGVELAVGVLYRVLRLLIGTQWRPQVCFAHDAPQKNETHRRMFGNSVRFTCDFNGIVCSGSDLDRAIPASDPVLARYARQYLEGLLARTNVGTADRVRELVWLQLASGRCAAEQVAGQLGMDRRVLHRRLATEHLTFSAIVEAVRTEIVTRMLASQERTLGSIADMTGFASLSAFSRWFHGRFGVSPTAWRRRFQGSGHLLSPDPMSNSLQI